MNNNYSVNANYVLAQGIISVLEYFNVTDICIAPGSRSAPFALALSDNHKIKQHIHFDERALAFLALGLAKSRESLIAIITTSGSAVANLFPAIMEAYTTSIPLIIITADRPYELLDCGANQTCMQNHIFGEYALFSHIPAADEHIPFSFIENKLSNKIQQSLLLKKPLHLNVEIREPIYEAETLKCYKLSPKNTKLTLEHQNNLHPCEQAIAFDKIISNETTIFIAGDLSTKQADAIHNYAQAKNIFIIADIQSNLRGRTNVCGDYEFRFNDIKFMSTKCKYMVVFGGRFISKKILNLISNYEGDVIWVTENVQNLNATAKQAQHIQFPIIELLKFTNSKFCTSEKLQNLLPEPYINLNTTYLLNKNNFSELSIINALSKIQSKTLFIGNSLIARYCDLLLTDTTKEIFTNRGVSGIDGQIATAAGIAQNHSVCAIIGDTTALYDLSSISLLQKYKLLLIIINNNGGNIFSKFPIHDENKLNTFFINPHYCNFQNIAKMFSIEYANPSNLDEFNYEITKNRTNSLIVEVNFSPKEGLKLYEKLLLQQQ
jgi:2-succinyl-5-enolpyruvyl-6-hydroxy-3-cyclohexene-1-carboxylate synthase